MAALAIRHAHMNRRGGLAARRRIKSRVTTGALTNNRHTAMEPCWRPKRKSTAMAGIAVGDHHASQGLIRNVIERARVRRRESAAVAGRTLVGDDDLGVIEPGRQPRRCGVAAGAICSPDRNVTRWFPGGRSAVVATCAVCCGREQDVIHLRASPTRRTVTVFAISNSGMYRRSRLADRRREAAVMTTRALRGDHHIRVKAGGRPGGVARFVAGVAIGDYHPRQRLIRNMVDWSRTSRGECTGVAAGALPGNGSLRVVKP